MNRTVTPFDSPRRSPAEEFASGGAHRWSSWSLSLCLHLCLVAMLVLAGLWAPRPPGGEKLRPTGIVLTEIQNQQTEYLDQEAVEQTADPQAAPPAAVAESSPAPALPVPDPTSPGAAPQLELPALDATAMTASEATRQPEFNQLSEADLRAMEADRERLRARGAVGEPTTIQVFGSGPLTGRSFVFLLDRSKSMGGGGLGVIQAARQELSQAIGQLESNHQFQILGYHEQTVPLRERQMLAATPENKAAVAPFLGDLAAFGATRHENAIITALSFRPDVVVLLTDGGLPTLNQGQLRAIHRMANGAQIHCVQFGMGPRRPGENFMTRLAADNAGSYRYVDVTGWNR